MSVQSAETSWGDPRTCKGLEMIAKGMEACDSFSIAPQHDYKTDQPWGEDVCPVHYGIMQTYLNQGFTLHYRRKDHERRE